MTKTMKAMKSAPERPSAKDFHVSADTFEITEKNLQTHLSIFNKDTQPEYFTDFEHKGVTYKRTQLVHKDMLMKAKDLAASQIERSKKTIQSQQEAAKRWKVGFFEEIARVKLKKKIENIEMAGLKEAFDG